MGCVFAIPARQVVFPKLYSKLPGDIPIPIARPIVHIHVRRTVIRTIRRIATYMGYLLHPFINYLAFHSV